MAANTDMHRPPTTDVFSHKHHDREQDPHSSQPSSSSDSFSAYVHHDAPIVQQRSSSPRLEHSLHDREGPTASPSARAQALKHRLASTTSDPFARAQFHQVQRTHFDPVRHLAHQQPQDDPKGDDEEYDELEDDEPVFRPQSHHPETAAFRGKAKDDDSSIVSTLYHVKSQNAVSAEEMRARKRRRRTRPDEVSILASVYAQNAFPDAQTRAELASRVGMSVR